MPTRDRRGLRRPAPTSGRLVGAYEWAARYAAVPTIVMTRPGTQVGEPDAASECCKAATGSELVETSGSEGLFERRASTRSPCQPRARSHGDVRLLLSIALRAKGADGRCASRNHGGMAHRPGLAPGVRSQIRINNEVVKPPPLTSPTVAAWFKFRTAGPTITGLKALPAEGVGFEPTMGVTP
jgi:hypothetical protein